MLGKAGATVYITGRTLGPKEGATLPGSLTETAQEVESFGGQCIPVQCDHGNDDDVQRLFERVKSEQNGRLDVLVNNAYKAVQAITETAGTPFFEQPVGLWDEVNNVGLRSNYIAAYYAAQIMVPAKQGLIINISSPGGITYIFNVPYGVGKAANDRMMQDMGIELKKHNVAAVSLWPGPVKTEVVEKFENETVDAEKKSRVKKIFANCEDVTFTGKAIAWLAADTNIMKKTGKVLVVAELAREYGFKDIGGALPLSFRQVKYWAQRGNSSLTWLVPDSLYIPCWLVGAATHKF